MVSELSILRSIALAATHASSYSCKQKFRHVDERKLALVASPELQLAWGNDATAVTGRILYCLL